MSAFIDAIAIICLVWSVFIVIVQIIGLSAIFRHFSSRPKSPVSPRLGPKAPHVTIIRPVKGLEPQLYDCIASTFQQDYPIDKVSVRLCVESRSDPAYPILTKLVQDFPKFDAQVFVETDDLVLHGANGKPTNLGPNPKVRNISRAYREAEGDVIWVIDCNVWVASGVLGRMIDKLMGYTVGKTPARPYKFVHQLPIVVDIVDYWRQQSPTGQSLLSSASEASPAADLVVNKKAGLLDRIWQNGGGRLDEMFMATSHVKFYGAINIVGVAPCIVGKSNMFRKSHLDLVTNLSDEPVYTSDVRPTGVDYFSNRICEDHLIGDLLWRSKIPGFSNHGIVWGDVVVQPMAGMSIAAYASRRCRWLRARKFTVLAATLVEPGVESLLCCTYFAFALTTLNWFKDAFGISQTWGTMFLIWSLAVTCWIVVDWFTFRRLHAGYTIEVNSLTPRFVKGTSNLDGVPRRHFLEWLTAWIGREVLALPIWTWAVLLGTTVNWRGKTFHVRMDTTVEELPSKDVPRGTKTPELERGKPSSKDRRD